MPLGAPKQCKRFTIGFGNRTNGIFTFGIIDFGKRIGKITFIAVAFIGRGGNRGYNADYGSRKRQLYACAAVCACTELNVGKRGSSAYERLPFEERYGNGIRRKQRRSRGTVIDFISPQFR